MTATQNWAEEADRLAQEGRIEDALRAYDAALAQSPEPLELLQRKAYALYAAGKLNEAAETFDSAIRIDNADPDLWRNRGVIAEQLERYEEAFESYDRALALNPESAQLWSDKADMQLALGQAVEALASYRYADELQAPVARDWAIRGHRFFRASRLLEAGICYDEALKLDEQEFEAWWGKGTAAAAQDDAAHAIEFLDKAAALATKPEARARILTAKGNEIAKQPESTAEALKCYDLALEAAPRNEDALLGRAVLLENLQRYPDAFAAYQELAKLDAQRADAWEGAGRCLTSLPGRMEEALECYDSAIKCDPTSFSAHADKGWVLIELKRYEQSVQACENAIGLLPGEAGPWINKGFALMELGRFEECERFLKQGIQTVADPINLRRNLNLLYSDYMFDAEKALQGAREIMEPGSEPLSEIVIAECLLRLGRYVEARDSALALEQRATAPIRNIASLIGLASCVLEANSKKSREYFSKLMAYLQDADRAPVTEREYYFRGMTRWLAASDAEPIHQFALFTLIDILTGKLDWNAFSFKAAASLPANASSPAS